MCMMVVIIIFYRVRVTDSFPFLSRVADLLEGPPVAGGDLDDARTVPPAAASAEDQVKPAGKRRGKGNRQGRAEEAAAGRPPTTRPPIPTASPVLGVASMSSRTFSVHMRSEGRATGRSGKGIGGHDAASKWLRPPTRKSRRGGMNRITGGVKYTYLVLADRGGGVATTE